MVTFLSSSGTSPSTIFLANPSMMAVLPTPASPTSSGLFLRRRASTWMTRSTSLSRPTSGSMSLFLARSLRFEVYASRGSAAAPAPSSSSAAYSLGWAPSGTEPVAPLLIPWDRKRTTSSRAAPASVSRYAAWLSGSE